MGMGDLPAVREPEPQRAGPPRHVSAEAMARVGMRLKDHEIKGVIGEGVIGVVYRAQNLVGDKPVAIKVLHDHCARQKDVVEKFIVEAKAASRIHHPNIVEATDFGTAPDGTFFLVMEHLDGESLEDRLRRAHHLPLFEAIDIVRQVAHGLGAAHELGIVHGDLKPANIFLCRREGRRRIVRRGKETGMRFAVAPEGSFDLVKLLDFGASKFMDFAPSAQTPTEAVCGTLAYLSPEQVKGQPTDPRSDIYALGAILYEMVTGTLPFGGETVLDVLNGHLSGAVIAPSRRAPDARMDLRIDSLILKCLKKNPLMRFAGTDELCQVLDGCVTDCAFLRDAHRLPGIEYSGIDLSEASPEARHDSAPVAERPAAAPVAVKPAAAPVAKPVAAAPVAEKPATAPVAKPALAALFAVKPAAAPVAKPVAAAPVAEKPARAPVAKPAAAAPVAEKPAAAPSVRASTEVPMADDPAAVVKTPPPEVVATDLPADDPAAAVKTPPLVVVAPDLPAEARAGLADERRWQTRERPEAPIPDVDDGPERLEFEDRASPSNAELVGSPRLRMMALGSVLLIGGVTVALWAGRGGPGPSSTKPAPATKMAPASAHAASAPPPLAAAQAAPPAAPTPAAPAAAPPAPAEPAKTAVRGPGKLASTRTRPTHENSARRMAPVIPVPAEAAPSPTAETTPTPEPEAPAPSQAAAAPEPSPPAPASAADLVREAQQAWMRGHHAVAIGKAQAALKAEPKRAQAMQAYQIIGSSSCAIGEAADAREAASHLDETMREMVRAACERRGVTIE
jgi:serine/threonine protein kinase